MMVVEHTPDPEILPIVSAVRALRLMEQASILLNHAGASSASYYLQLSINALSPKT